MMDEKRKNYGTQSSLLDPDEDLPFRWTAHRLRRALQSGAMQRAHIDDEALASCIEARESDATLQHLLHCTACTERLRSLNSILASDSETYKASLPPHTPPPRTLTFALHVVGRSAAPPQLIASSENVRVQAPEAARLRAAPTDLRLDMGETCPIANLTLQLQPRSHPARDLRPAHRAEPGRWTLRASLRTAPLDIEIHRSGQLVAALHCPQTHMLVPDLRPGFFELHLSSPRTAPQFALFLLQSA